MDLFDIKKGDEGGAQDDFRAEDEYDKELENYYYGEILRGVSGERLVCGRQRESSQQYCKLLSPVVFNRLRVVPLMGAPDKFHLTILCVPFPACCIRPPLAPQFESLW